jgi:hypothetical protein
LYDPELDEKMQASRKIAKDFFMNTLGFDEDSYIMIDYNEIIAETYSDETKAKLTKFSRSVIEDA